MELIMKHLARSLTLLAALATVGVTGIPTAEAQNAAAQRGDRLAGPKVTEGRITSVDRAGRIVLVDGRRFLLHDGVALQDISMGQQVSVVFEETGMGGDRRAVRITNR
jgi:hypothetical protein